jgi:hypothetical protein
VLVVVDHDDTEHRYTDVSYNLGTAGLTTCTIIDPATGEALVQHHDVLMTRTYVAREADR